MARLHVEVHPYGVICVRIVTLRREDEDTRKFGITVECTDAGNNVSVEDLEGLSGNDDFATSEARTARLNLFIDNLVEFPGVLERETEERDNLSTNRRSVS